jgi:hypothetical protein
MQHSCKAQIQFFKYVFRETLHLNVLAIISHKGRSVMIVREDISKDPVNVSATVVACL